MRFFEPLLLNGPTGDPALYVELQGQGRSLLFDCGRLHRLKPQQALRLTDVFISHTHIDHFVGFDHLLRILLGSDRHLRVWGPPGFIDNLQGKLQAYTWNLVDDQKLVVEAYEVVGSDLYRKAFHCSEAFSPTRPVVTSGLGPDGLLFDDGMIEVHHAVLDHIIPSLAFSVREKDRTNVDEEALVADGLEPGPWLKAAKDRAASYAPDDQPVETPVGPLPFRRFRDRYLRTTPGEKLSYVADNLFGEENLAKVVPLVRASDLLVCEGGFLSEDEDKARKAHHLTAAQAGALGRLGACKEVSIFHFSPKYLDRLDDLHQDARHGFEGGEAP